MSIGCIIPKNSPEAQAAAQDTLRPPTLLYVAARGEAGRPDVTAPWSVGSRAFRRLFGV